MVRDPYGTLGVSPGCSEDELKSAYRRLAKRYHPDLHPGDAAAAERMNEINAAYDQIRNGPAPGSAPYGGSGGAAYGYASQTQGGADYDPFAAYRAWQEQAWQQSQQQRYTSYQVFRPGRVLLRVFLFFIIIRFLFSLLGGALLTFNVDQDTAGAAPYSYYAPWSGQNSGRYGYYYSYPDAGQSSTS